MLNKEKIRLMTRAAIYEKQEGKEDLKINQYGQSDYIRFQMVKTLIGVVISVSLCCGIYLICTAEDIFSLIFQVDLMALARLLAAAFAVSMAVYVIICILFYRHKYLGVRKRLKRYNRLLSMIAKEDDSSLYADASGGKEDHG